MITIATMITNHHSSFWRLILIHGLVHPSYSRMNFLQNSHHVFFYLAKIIHVSESWTGSHLVADRKIPALAALAALAAHLDSEAQALTHVRLQPFPVGPFVQGLQRFFLLRPDVAGKYGENYGKTIGKYGGTSMKMEVLMRIS